MIQAINAIGCQCAKVDSEYLMIMMEMRKLGLTPTGNKVVDKAALEAEKNKLAEKVQAKLEIKNVDKTDDSQRAMLEEQKLGAMTVAELNKILHGLV